MLHCSNALQVNISKPADTDSVTIIISVTLKFAAEKKYCDDIPRETNVD